MKKVGVDKKIEKIVQDIKGLSASIKEKYGTKLLEIRIGLSHVKEFENVILEETRCLYRKFEEKNDESESITKKLKKRHRELNSITNEYKSIENQLNFFTEKVDDSEQNKNLTVMMKKDTTDQLNRGMENFDSSQMKEIEKLNDMKKKEELEIEFLEKSKNKFLQNISELETKINVLKEEIKRRKYEKRTLNEKINLQMKEPERIKQQYQIIGSFVMNIDNQLKKVLDKKNEIIQKQETIQMVISQTKLIISKYKKDRESKKIKIKNVHKEIDKAKKQLQELNYQASINDKELDKLKHLLTNKKSTLYIEQKKAKEKKKELSIEQEKVNKVNRIIENISKGIKRLIDKKDITLSKKKKMGEELNKTIEKVKETNLFVDMAINNFLIEEDKGKILSDSLVKRNNEVKDLEIKLKQMKKEEKEKYLKIVQLKKERERLFTQVSNVKKKFIELIGHTKMQNFINKEIRKNFNKKFKETRDTQQKYQHIKLQRNKYAKKIQDSSITLSQYLEKRKILENELEILQRKSLDKEKEIQKKERKNHHLISRREENKRKQSKLDKEYEALKEFENEISNTILKLNKVIELDENEMLNLKDEFQRRIEERNFNGIQLMDRNDELCILHEKANFQKDIIQKGEIELRNMDEQVRILSIHVNSLLRELVILNEKLPHIHSVIKEKENLIKEIETHSKTNAKLNLKIEDTTNPKRFNNLDDKEIPKKGELVSKIDKLKGRLAIKKELILEKQLILKEITQTTSKLQDLSQNSKDYCLNVNQNLNNLKKDIIRRNDTLKALISELSIYQARKMTLEVKNKQLSKNYKRMNDKYERGLPPTKEMIDLWRKERELNDRRRAYYENFTMKQSILKSNISFATVTRTTAIKRPNAYLPTSEGELDIPKPYLIKPVLPIKTGVNQRFYVKQKPKSIVL